MIGIELEKKYINGGNGTIGNDKCFGTLNYLDYFVKREQIASVDLRVGMKCKLFGLTKSEELKYNGIKKGLTGMNSVADIKKERISELARINPVKIVYGRFICRICLY